MKEFADRVVMAAFDLLTLAGVIASGWPLYRCLKAENAIQTAALAAVALGVLGIPHVLGSMYHRILVRERWRRDDV